MPTTPSNQTPLPRRLAEAHLTHIALVGMPGAGKSRVAIKLGAALGLPVLDLDEAIAAAARQSITQLFLERGEVLFRAQERAVLRELLHQGEPSVIACGGGTWADATMRRDLSSLSVPICLTAPVEVLLERLADPAERRARPLLGGPDPIAALRKLERERRSAYLQCPDQVDTQGLEVEQVTQAVLALLEQPHVPRPLPEPQPRASTQAQPASSSSPTEAEPTTPQASQAPHTVPAVQQAQAVADEQVHAAQDGQLASATDAPAEPASAAEATTQPSLPEPPQIPWWPQATGDSEAIDGAQEPLEDAAEEQLMQAEHEEPNPEPEPERGYDLAAGQHVEHQAAPLGEEHTPTMAQVAQRLEPFAGEAMGEESWQPQMRAWAPLDDGRGEQTQAFGAWQLSEASASPLPETQAEDATEAPMPEDPMQLRISAQHRSYTVHMADSPDGQLAELMAAHAGNKKLAIICDTQINALFVEPLRNELLAAGLTVSVHTFVAGEEAKTLKTAYGLYDELADAQLGRSDLIVGFGGGVTLDVAGFVASTYMRGTQLMLIPTSTLAAVDACVGGKNGVNTRRGKNLVGTIYPPHVVFIAMHYLATQSRRAHTAGLVEVLKMGALLDRELFLEVASGSLLKLSQPEARTAMRRTLARALTLKAQVVEQDEHEVGHRAILNYGHTVGHALEIEHKNGLSHGEAVGLGMLAEAAWAEAQGFGHGIEAQLRQALEAMNMPVDWRRAKLRHDALHHDKKRRGKNVRLPVLRALGEVELREIPIETLAHYTQPPASEA